MFNTVEEAYDWLFQQKKLSKRKDLSRIERCCRELSLMPSFPMIHIAGTNGKGSTASYIKNILKHTGRHVGLFVSPYVVCFNERIQINDRMISNAEILYYANQLKEYADGYFHKYADCIPFFELTLLMALWYFKDRKIDMAVIECGVGGLLDATNFLPYDLAIITNVGYDHMNTLGNTLEEIALHKLGIVKENMTCLTCVEDALKPLFISYAERIHANMVFVDKEVKDISLKQHTWFTYKEVSYHAGLLAKYQAYNAALAIEAVRFIEPDIPYDLIQAGLESTFWPGRMEWVSHKPEILLDGAHNIHGIRGLVDSLKVLAAGRRVSVLFSALHDKDFKAMIAELDSIAARYYFTTIEDKRSTEPMEFAKFTHRPYQIVSSYTECLDTAVKELAEDELLLITGSLHFISSIRSYLMNKIQ